MARIDKYLWAVRLFKTRSLAANQIKNKKVFLNDEPVKTAKEVKIGDRIGIKKNTALFEYEVVDLLEKRVGAKLVPDYLRDITRQEEKDRYQEYLNAQKEYRANGLGRPTTKERRALKKLWKKGL